jgi:hypothetical protein
MADQLILRRKRNEETRAYLNLEQRKQIDGRLDKSLLAIENKRRTAQNLKPFVTIDEWEEAEDKQDKDELPTAEKDPMLYETGVILSDQIRMLGTTISATSIKRSMAHTTNN